jgi:hypothetical protein
MPSDSYKFLALVDRAFRCIKTVDLQVRPVHHWLADRVRACRSLHVGLLYQRPYWMTDFDPEAPYGSSV